VFFPHLKVVHQRLGIGTVVAVESRQTPQGPERILTCQFLQPGEAALTLQVAERVGTHTLRGLVEPDQVPLILEHLENSVPPPAAPRSLVRKRHFREKFKNVDVYSRCDLLKELSHLKSRMPGEQQMLLIIRSQLSAELALVSGQPLEHHAALIDRLCKLRRQ